MKSRISITTILSLFALGFISSAYAFHERGWERHPMPVVHPHMVPAHHFMRHPHWTTIIINHPLPETAIIGGGITDSDTEFYICRAPYHGGMYPGRFIDGRCYIGFNGDELALPHYEILETSEGTAWVAANAGYIPPDAIQAGYENGRTLYVCQAPFHGNMYPGKIFGGSCHITVGGREVIMSRYNILIQA